MNPKETGQENGSGLRILHVVTLVTPDGAFGGPVRVAMNQAKALREAGHDVVVAGAQRGFRSPPESEEGVTLKLFPAFCAIPMTGFAGLVSPGLLRWLWRNIATFDIVHIHLARDLVTLPAAWITRRARVPYVLQPHGMIDESPKLAAAVLDRVLTATIVKAAHATFYLTETEHISLMELFGSAENFVPVQNGVPYQPNYLHNHGDRLRILFLGRLHERKSPMAFVEMAIDVLERGFDVEFSLVGADEGEAQAVVRRVSESGWSSRISWGGASSPTAALECLMDSEVYVLSSRDDVYPMSVLEAMSLGVPVVVTPGCGLAEAIASNGTGLVTDGTVAGLSDAVVRMIESRALRETMGGNGRNLVRREHSMAAICILLLAQYRTALS